MIKDLKILTLEKIQNIYKLSDADILEEIESNPYWNSIEDSSFSPLEELLTKTDFLERFPKGKIVINEDDTESFVIDDTDKLIWMYSVIEHW
jgi:hypothetical protein